jgi:hypothetical protein
MQILTHKKRCEHCKRLYMPMVEYTPLADSGRHMYTSKGELIAAPDFIRPMYEYFRDRTENPSYVWSGGRFILGVAPSKGYCGLLCKRNAKQDRERSPFEAAMMSEMMPGMVNNRANRRGAGLC